ncbi:histidine phosphatase family protein [Streptomyces violascens]|uniref:Phosphoglycerate mutase n=1 Tax=Streptomyces violascens TaxID=67381 RepID=A0ABQ3QEP6_9ACTN|nr:histidine phosphatase family protein [Streptomyces violascens]GGU00284.1 phosphoglycerate mutase [Streptomyces violascens]GHI35753.1 phosphoglycerate mutase [Streptomyces violascens]
MQHSAPPTTATRYLYLARHGDAGHEGPALTDAGRRQAALLGRRLARVPFDAVHHGPLGRAAETARLIAAELDGATATEAEWAGDYVPYWPERGELPESDADRILGFLGDPERAEREAGPRLVREAMAHCTGPVVGASARHELVVTHSFLTAWLVRAALDAPGWRWIGLNHCNAPLTVIRYAPDRPASVLLLNDMAHLPAELKWTGFPEEFGAEFGGLGV